VPLDALADTALAEARMRFPEREIKVSRAKGGLTAQCDPHLVAHILDNLLSNALKYSPADRPVECRIFAQGGQVACAVTDQGQGIPLADQPYVFERYFRGHGQEAGQGIGLGLALAQELAQLQGGRVTMETWPGRGSVFTLWLPGAGAEG
jgi:signal transduction histidine kinase